KSYDTHQTRQSFPTRRSSDLGQNAPTEVALVGDGKAIVAQINQALEKREWVYPSDMPWHASIAEKAAANAAQIAPQLADDQAPRSEEHTSELQSRVDLVCRLL